MTAPGKCVFCGHTDADPNRDELGEELGWLNKLKTCCTARRCVMAWEQARKAAKRSLEQERHDVVKPIAERDRAALAKWKADKDAVRRRGARRKKTTTKGRAA